MNDLTGKYFVKNTENGDYTDFATLFDGLRILKIDGFTAKGQAKNVYTASWEYDEEEDFAIVMQDDEDPVKIIRECTDLDITFIIKGSYATNTIDAQRQHLAFVDYMTNTDVWVKSAYQNNLEVHCVCLKEYKPTTEKYKRGVDSYVMGTITMHMLEEPSISYTVKYTLDGVTTKYKVYDGEGFVLPLVAESGKQIIPASVNVSMSESDITDDTYNYETNTIAISNIDDTVLITAESAVIASTYQPMLFIRGLYASNAKTTAFTIPYYANNNTKIVFDVSVYSNSANTSLFSTRTYREKPQIVFQIKQGTNNRSAFNWGTNDSIYTNANTRIDYSDLRQDVILDKNTITYTDATGNRTTLTAPNQEFQLPSTQGLDIGGEVYATSGYMFWGNIRLFRTTISEENTLMHDLVPCRDSTNGRFGLYDTTSGLFYSKINAYWLGNSISIQRSLSNCSEAIQSGGTVTFAIIGQTWSSKFTASNNYTFNGGTFKVMVNGEDKTSQLATYNSTNDSWTVTLVAHWKDTIEITATAVAS